MKKLKETIKNIMKEESEYQTFFKKALEKSGKSIPQMSDEEKKAFFNKIDAAWDGKGEKNEELVGKQHKLDIDGDGEIEASDLAALRAGKKKDESVNEAKTYSNKFVAWFTGTVLNTVKHPKYGKNQLTPDQIASSPGEYKDKLFKAIQKAVKNGDITPDMIKKNESVSEATHTITSGHWVGFTKTPKGKKYYNTFKSGKAAQDWAIKNNGGAMPKKDWDEKEAKYAVESVNEADDTDKVWVVTKNKGQAYQISKKAYNANKDRYILGGNRAQANTYAKQIRDTQKKSESVNEEMDTITKEKWAKTHKDYKMMRNGVPYILKMVNGATTLVPVKIVKETQTVSENFSTSDIDKIKGAVEDASSFMGIGAQLKKMGMKYDFSTSPLPVYMIKKGAKTFVLVNKKYAEDPQFVIGDTAGGLLEGKINEGNAFGAAVTKAKKEGLKEFEFNGKKYKVKKGSYEKNESAKKLAEKSEVVTKK